MNYLEKELKKVFTDADRSDWSLVRFGDIVREVKETCSDPENEGIERVVGLEHLTPLDIHIRDWKSVSDGTTFTKVFRKGQVLFGRRRAYQRKAALAEFDGVCSGDIIVMEAVEKKLFPKLLPFIVHSDKFYDWAVRTSAGSLSPRTKFKHLAELEFNIPPFEVQKKIYEALLNFELLEGKYLNLIDQLKITEQVLANQYIPKQKEKPVPLSNFVTVEKGISYSAGDIKEDEGLPLINLNCFEKFGGFNSDGIKYYTGKYKEKNIVKTGDIVIAVTDITRNGDVIGYPVLVPEYDEKVLISMDCCKLALDSSKLKPKFLYFLLKTEWAHKHMYAHSRGTTVLHLDIDGIGKLQVDNFSPERQEQAIEVLSQTEKSIFDTKTLLVEVRKMKQGLINRVI